MDSDEVMIVAAIEDYINLVNQNISRLKPKTAGQKTARAQAIEDVNYVQRASVFNLRTEFEKEISDGFGN